MWINKKGEKLTLTFPYSPTVVSAIKTIPGRKFNDRIKRWEVPIGNIVEAVRILKPLGFNLHIDVVEHLRAARAFEKKLEEIRTSPPEYTGKLPLYDFQRQGAAFMRAMPASLLGDVPGLGKTIQTIAALEENHGPHLILCPASLKYSWESEIKKWEPDATVMVIDGSKEERVWDGKQKYVIANYELLLRDLEEIIKIGWETIVCDEAQRISNPRAKTTKALKTIPAKKRLALSGTPISNRPEDIWSIIDWIQPGYLGKYSAFQERYCVMDDSPWVDPKWRKVSSYKNLDELSDKINRLMMRRTKEEVLNDFPKKTTETIKFDLSSTERSTYNAVKNQIWDELQKLEIEGHNLHVIPVKMLRLKQITNHPGLVSDDANFDDLLAQKSTKLELLKSLLEGIVQSGEKAIVFTQFAEMAKIISAELRNLGYNPLLIFGDVSTPDRFVRVEQFRKDPTKKVIIMTEAGSYGLNMQEASYVIHYDAPWSVSKLQQREDRSHRIGQKKPVTVYNLVARNTIDEYVARVLHEKQKTSVTLLKDFERLEGAGLSEEDIKNILRL